MSSDRWKRNVSGRFFLLILIQIFFLSAPSLKATDSEKKQQENLPGYLWPTNASRTISSSFGESRDGHYHFGIDIRTNSTEGYPCYAVADGDVVRLRVSPYGYGKALYLRLKDGKTVVYAHLQKFPPRIEKIVKEEQYRQQQFRCQMYFQPGELPILKGEIIAYTGSTGIGLPHLHFEIRDEEGYLNPLNFGFTVEDSRPPKPKSAALFPLDFHSEIDADFKPKTCNIRSVPEMGDSYYKVTCVPAVFGLFGLGISGDDHTNGASNPVCFYGINLFLDDSLCFSVNYNAIKFHETKQIELERDFRLWRRTGEVFHHLWRDSYMTADFYTAGKGLIDTRDFNPGIHEYKIILRDYAGNETTVFGQVNFLQTPVYPYTELSYFPSKSSSKIVTPTRFADLSDSLVKMDFYPDYVILTLRGDGITDADMSLKDQSDFTVSLIKKGDYWIGKIKLDSILSAGRILQDWDNKMNKNGWMDSFYRMIQPVSSNGGIAFSEDGRFRVEFYEDDLYRPLYTRIAEELPPDTALFSSKIYRLDPYDEPIRGYARVAIAFDDIEPEPNQLGIYTLTKRGNWQFVDNDRQKVPGSVYGATPKLETYALLRDSKPPTLRWLAPNLTTTAKKPVFRLNIKDALSGVDDRTLDFRLDGEWLLMEYNPESNRIFGSPEKPLNVGDHLIEVRVRDYCGNEARLDKTLRIISQ